MLMWLLVFAAVLFVCGWKYWPDICRSIVNTGLEADKPKEPTAVERLHEVVHGPPPIRADPAAAALSNLLNKPTSAK
jgi:hypothetical protein